MKLITELTEQVEFVAEDVGGKKNWFIEGIYLQAGIKNRNGRVYPPPVMEREALRYIKEKIDRGCAYGELGHPSGPQLNMERISHHVVGLKKSGNDWLGKSRLIDEGYGKIARGILEAEGRLGVSSRGMGTLKEDKKAGCQVVQDDFQLHVCADIVGDPSAPSAWVNGIMEGVEWVQDEQGIWEMKVAEVRQAVHATPRAQLTETKLALFEDYMETFMETQMVDMLSKAAKVDPKIAQDAVRRAKVKMKITGQHHDQRYVWTAARDILGLGGR